MLQEPILKMTLVKTLKELLANGYILADDTIIFKEKLDDKDKTILIYKKSGENLYEYYGRYIKRENIRY